MGHRRHRRRELCRNLLRQLHALGLPCVRASHADLKQLGEAIQANPKLTLTVDLVKQTVQYGNATGDVSVPCTMAEGPRTALVTGEFDFLAQLLAGENADSGEGHGAAIYDELRVAAPYPRDQAPLCHRTFWKLGFP